jgi:glycosyltransferase involved in cell wall biosynthesis
VEGPAVTASIGVVIATYGSNEWRQRAQIALASVESQTSSASVVTHIHHANGSLAQARNEGADSLRTDWLVFLDADDTLDHHYIEAMQRHAGDEPALLQPATLGVYPDGREDDHAVLIPQRPLDTGNFMVIGTAIRRDQFLRVGGFKEWPLYEDWCLWIRAWQDGATFVPVSGAIYRVGVNPKSRNQAEQREQVRYFKQIRTEYFG